MKKTIVGNTFKLLSLFVILQILTTIVYYLVSYLIVIPFSVFSIVDIFTIVYTGFFPIISTVLIVILLYKYGYNFYCNKQSKTELIFPVIINCIIVILYELFILIGFMGERFESIYFLFVGINPLAVFCVDLINTEKFKILFIILSVLIVNIINTIALYFGIKKKLTNFPKNESDDNSVSNNN